MTVEPITADRQSALHSAAREEAARRRIARHRVELMGIEHCRLCGLATNVADVVGVKDAEEILCDCAMRQAALAARALRLANRHAAPRDQLADKIAP